MSSKTIAITLTGQIEKGSQTDIKEREFKYECHYLTLDLKTGQQQRDSFIKNLPIDDSAMLIAVSEGCIMQPSPEALRRLPIETMTKWLIKTSHQLPFHERLMRGIEEANYQIWRAANEEATGIVSASLAAAVIESNIAFVVQVGDAGAFIIRNGRIRRLPNQVSAMQIIAADDNLAEDADEPIWLQLELGSNKVIQPSVTAVELQVNDQLLLCTDGILNNLGPADILQIRSEER